MLELPSPWLAGLALGLMMAAIYGLAALNGGQPVPWDRCVTLLLIGIGTVPTLTFFVNLFLALLGKWAETRPVPLDDSEPIPDTDPDVPDYTAEAWRVALDRLFRAGDTAGGFSAAKLSGVVGSDAWPKLVHFYSSHAGGNVLRDAGSNVGHVWGHGWNLDRLMLALGNDRLPRPDMPLPVVQPFVASTTQRRASQKSKTALVIDNN